MTTDLIDSKTEIPALRPGIVPRESVVRRLCERPELGIVSVSAPGGYGKTTLLAQWSEADPRTFAWLTLDERDNDPVLLLRYVLASLERRGLLRAVEPEASRELLAWGSLLPIVAAALWEPDRAYVLVLDDVHALQGEALDVLGALVRSVPEGSQLVLSGRGGDMRLLARHRAAGRLLELGAPELALSEDEALALLDAAGAGLPREAAVALHRRTEGWPAGLYLAALAAQASGGLPPAETTVDRFVEDYLRAEHLARLPSDQFLFLTRSSVLDRMSAELCDAALERTDSRQMLDLIERSNLFLVPLDRERRWFRYHELFRAELRRELDHLDSTAAAAVAVRASAWCEQHGEPEQAVAYGFAAGDRDRVARLIVPYAFALYRTGRMATVIDWYDRFDDEALLARHPEVGVLGALLQAITGRAFRAERWLSIATRAVEATGDPMLRARLATVRAMFCAAGPEQMERDAAFAVNALAPHDPFAPVALGLHGMARWLRGDRVGGEEEIARAADYADTAGATLMAVTLASQRALIALARGDVGAARSLIDAARPAVGDAAFTDYMPVALMLVADAQTAIREGNRELAARRLAAAQRLRPHLMDAIPVVSVLTLAELAAAYLAAGQPAAAKTVLVDADDVMARRPRLGILVDRVAELHERIAASDRGDDGWAATLTAAELRLLPLLTTHLTFREIGERLFISRNTVKTEAISIYRKLGASSRGEAVQKAVELGLVEPLAGGAGTVQLTV